MNREQRRKAAREGQIVNIPVDQLVFPQKMTSDECLQIALWRLRKNFAETGHPFHHLTANDVIVDADPTLEYLLSRLTKTEQENIRRQATRHVKPDAPKAVPINRKFYGHDPYERN